MFEMTPELQAELIKYFLASIGGLGIIIMASFWAVMRHVNNRMEQNKKDRESEREIERKQRQAEIDAQEREWKLRYEEIKGDQSDKDKLFELNHKQAEYGEMTARALDRLVSEQQGTSSQIEIFSQQLKVAVGNTGETKTSIAEIPPAIREIKQVLAKLQETIAQSLEKAADENKAQLHTIFSEISAITRILNLIQEQNDITQKIPPLPEPTNGNPADDNDDNDNQPKEDIA